MSFIYTIKWQISTDQQKCGRAIETDSFITEIPHFQRVKFPTFSIAMLVVIRDTR